MGGQACIVYGAAEFSRDIDVAVAVDAGNLARLRAALRDLEAEPVYFPSLTAAALRRGHACHFRCHAPGLGGVRLDVMAVMRGADAFGALWRRRKSFRLSGGLRVDVMGLSDLVRVKKTQRDKDWPMVRRLVEADIASSPRRPSADRVRFWLRECRTPDLIIDVVRRFPRVAERESRRREALRVALRGTPADVEWALRDEEDRERAADRRYWEPLRLELEASRLARRRGR
jgi:hypothetical protein